jgi:hypothetical protein
MKGKLLKVSSKTFLHQLLTNLQLPVLFEKQWLNFLFVGFVILINSSEDPILYKKSCIQNATEKRDGLGGAQT